MATHSKALVAKIEEGQNSNGWEKLLVLLDPVVANAPQVKDAWQRLDRKMVVWLSNTVVKFPWLNHLALAGAIYSEGGAAHPSNLMNGLHSFLRWAIPACYPDLLSLKPTEALIAYFGDPPHRRGETASAAYAALQIHMQHYITALSEDDRAKLTPFLFPVLVSTPHLSQLRGYTANQGRAKRKEQAFAVVKDLNVLVAMGRRRYKWLVDLDAQVQGVAELVRQQQITLPTIINCRDLDDRQDLTFRVWDRTSWIKAHRKAYGLQPLRKKAQDSVLFLQLVGNLPGTPWFLRAAELGALGNRGKKEAQAKKYFRDCNVPPFTRPGNGLITLNKGWAGTLCRARQAADGTPQDSRVLFCVEPLLAGAAVGLFALVCLTQSGMRIGELQQVSGDKNCMKVGHFPQFNEAGGGFTDTSKLFFWQLYPKGSTQRQPYPVTPYMQEALKVWMEVHERFCGNFKAVSPDTSYFTHVRRFPGKYQFVLQWHGEHLSSRRIEMCLDFLLLEHLCLDSQGKPTRITAHVLRHGLAGYLRHQGVPLEDIAGLLHQVNLAVTDHYSKLSSQDLFTKLGPFLTRLGDLAEIDPATLRTVGDIQQLGQEALKRFGILRRIPGGTCAVFTSCEVQFKCAGCPSYIPDSTRRDEVHEKIVSCSRTAQFLERSGDYLQAEVQRAHCRNWERIEKEMEALAAIELTSPPLENALTGFGIGNLNEVDEAWLLALKQQPQLPSGDDISNV